MDEAQIVTEITGLLKRNWLWTHKPRDSENYAVGTPDVLVLNAAFPTVIEVKMFARSSRWDNAVFPFRNISVEQRAWLEMWIRDGEEQNRPQYSWLALGTRLGRAGAKDKPRRLWLIPWRNWLSEVEHVLRPHRLSLPLAKCKGQKPAAVQEFGLNAINLLAKWELVWYNSHWIIPTEHLFSKTLTLSAKPSRDTADFRRRWKHLKENIERELNCNKTNAHKYLTPIVR